MSDGRSPGGGTHGAARLAWLQLRGGVVVALGGALEEHGLLGHVRVGEALGEDVVWGCAVRGPLPIELRAIALVGAAIERVDVLAWERDGDVHVVLVDTSAAALAFGDVLQRGNGDDLLRERLAGAERMRRTERRARGEALSALGYELLERGPDGGYRPTAEPSEWLRRLCDWSTGKPRVLRADDPVDFLTGFLVDADSFLASAARDGADDGRLLSSGVWSEALVGIDGATRDQSFEAHAIALPSGRGVVAVEHLDASVAVRQDALQRQRDAELSYEALAREIQVKDVLLHCIVHDLRGPLASLVGSLSLIERGGLTDDEERELVQIGLRQARRQEEMIAHVLEVFAAEYEALRSFEVAPDVAPDLVAIATETVKRQGPAFQVQGIPLVLSAPEGALRVVGRADRLERVVSNLVGNALRHAPKGTAVEVVVEATEGGARLSVLDRGPGVPEALRPTLFQRFVQGARGGSVGLGLYYVRMTVERWGGTATYGDREGGGAAFHVDLVRPG